MASWLFARHLARGLGGCHALHHSAITPLPLHYRCRTGCFASRAGCKGVAASWGPVRTLNPMQQGSSQNSDEVGTPLEGQICGLHLVEQRLTVLGQELVLVAPRSVDDVIDLYIGNSARSAELLLKMPALVKGKQVLELGCGLGIAGLASAFAGAQHVTLTDRDTVALQFALRSAQASGLRTCSSIPTPAGIELRPMQSEAGQVSAASVDWQTPETLDSLPAQVVVAADVMYDSAAPALLARVLSRLAQRDAPCAVLIADPEERTKHHREEFLRLVSSGPDSCFVVENNTVQKVQMDGISSSICIMQLAARPAAHPA